MLFKFICAASRLYFKFKLKVDPIIFLDAMVSIYVNIN